MRYCYRTADPARLAPVAKAIDSAPLTFDRETRTMRVRLTTEHVDRYGEVVVAAGMRAVKRVPFLLQHGGDVMRGMWPLGYVADLTPGRCEDGVPCIDGTAHWYAPGEGVSDPDVLRAMDMAEQGIITGISIGFRPYEAEKREVVVPGDDRPEDDPPESVLHYTDWELLELSLVTVPANPEAQVLDGDDAVETPEDAEIEAELAALVEAEGQAVADEIDKTEPAATRTAEQPVVTPPEQDGTSRPGGERSAIDLLCDRLESHYRRA